MRQWIKAEARKGEERGKVRIRLKTTDGEVQKEGEWVGCAVDELRAGLQEWARSLALLMLGLGVGMVALATATVYTGEDPAFLKRFSLRHREMTALDVPLERRRGVLAGCTALREPS